MDQKQNIIDALDVIRRKEISAGKANNAVFKARAYADAIRILKGIPRISSMDDVHGKGLGEKILLKVDEILKTGKLSAAEEIKTSGTLGIYDALLACYGIGPVRARELVGSNIKSIDDLRSAVSKNSSILNDKQQIGLKYYDDLIQRIPRSEMLVHEATLYSAHWRACSSFNPHVTSRIVGSFRRGAETSGDIDMLILGDDVGELEKFVAELKRIGYLKEILAEGRKKVLGICQLPGGVARRLDLLLTPEVEWGYALLYFTGSDVFNVAFRSWALELGYTLNEHEMKPVNSMNPVGLSPVPILKSEKDIFRFLGLKWVEPKDRVGMDRVCPEV